MIIRHKAKTWNNETEGVAGFVIQAPGLYTKIIKVDVVNGEVYDTLFRVDPTSVCMSTETVCRDDKLIYENDIILNKERDMKLIVKYLPRFGKFFLYQPIEIDGKTTYNRYDFNEFKSFENFEMIGNVLDNEMEDKNNEY